METLLILSPVILVGTLIIVFLKWWIPEIKNDTRWYKYEAAYDRWESNGEKGKMPTPEDYGWISPSEK